MLQATLKARRAKQLLIGASLFICSLALQTTTAGQLQPRSEQSGGYGFSLKDLKGTQHALTDYAGKVVLVNFWASWCPPCIKEMPEMAKLKQRMEGRPFEILALNVGEKKYKVWKFVRLVEFDLPVLLDTSSDAFRAWGVETLPTSFLVDAEGRVRYRVRGDPGWNRENTIAVIEQLIAEIGSSDDPQLP